MIPWIHYNVINIGPLPIQVWGLFVAIGLIVSVAIITKRAPKMGLQKEQILDMVIWALFGGFIMSRIFHIALYEPGFYIANPLEMVKVWQGGLSSFGGVAGAALGILLYAKRKGIVIKTLLPTIDLLSFSALFGWIFGRIGCFLIHDHPGTLSHSFLAVKNPNGSRLDMAFLEILALLPLVVFFILTRKKKYPEGFYTAILFIYYGITRIVLDFFRATDV